MYHFLDDFLADWKHESDSTIRLFKHLTDASLDQKVTPDGRNLGRLAWHITGTLGELMNRTGLAIDGPTDEDPIPASAADITAMYEQSSNALLQQMITRWNDRSLQDECDMYGQKWKNGRTLSILVAHQTHHRGQMTVLMRQAGLPVPGVYGPSKEEWANMGMPAQE